MKDFAYLSSITNLKKILEKIQSAGTPPRFTHEFLKSTLGFTSSNDRSIIPVLKQLGFLKDDGIPTDRYNEFKSVTTSGKAIAHGLKDGWSDIFLADQNANDKKPVELKGIFKTVTGKSDSVAEKMSTTFKALSELGDWKQEKDKEVNNLTNDNKKDTELEDEESDKSKKPSNGITLRHDVHVHLPPTSDVSVYKAIFRALREELID